MLSGQIYVAGILTTYVGLHVGRDGIAEGSGDRIASCGGRNFPHPSRPFLEPTLPAIQSVPGGKAAGAWR